MYINTFKYTPKDVSCQLCTEYVKKLGCTALRCPWLAERIEAGVVGYREAVLETFPHERRLFQRLNLLIKHYPGSLWSNEQHERRMQYQCAVQGYSDLKQGCGWTGVPLCPFPVMAAPGAARFLQAAVTRSYRTGLYARPIMIGLWGISLCTSLAGCLALTTWQIRRRREEEALQIIEK